MYRVAMESSSDVMFEYLLDTDTFISYEPKSPQGVVRRELPNIPSCFRTNPLSIRRMPPMVLDNICNGRGGMFEVRVITPDTAPGDYRWHQVKQQADPARGAPQPCSGDNPEYPRHKGDPFRKYGTPAYEPVGAAGYQRRICGHFYVNLTEDHYYAVRLPQLSDSLSFSRTGSYSSDFCSRLIPPHRRIRPFQDIAALQQEYTFAGFSQTSYQTEVEFRQSDVSNSNWMRLGNLSRLYGKG